MNLLKTDAVFAGVRLDRYMRSKYSFSPAFTLKLTNKKELKVNGCKASPKQIISPQDTIEIWHKIELNNKNHLDQWKELQAKTTCKSYQSAFGDVNDWIIDVTDDLIAIDKPAGLAVHGGPGIKTSLMDLLPQLLMLSTPPHLLHRIDKETSGVLILGRSHDAALRFQTLKEQHLLKKEYTAIIPNKNNEHMGGTEKNVIECLIGSRWINGMERFTIDGPLNSKYSSTLFRTLQISKDHRFRLMSLSPVTGRKHQLRVVCADHFKCPILGDVKYGGRKADRLYLHSTKIGFCWEGKNMSFQSPIPQSFTSKITGDKFKE